MRRIRVIDDQIWCCMKNKIQVLSTDCLELVRSIDINHVKLENAHGGFTVDVLDRDGKRVYVLREHKVLVYTKSGKNDQYYIHVCIH